MKPDPKHPAATGKPPQRKVFDVRRPGRAPASSTSRPIIGHKLMVQDSSVSMNGVGESRHIMDSRKKISITSHDADPEAPAAQVPVSFPAAEAAPESVPTTSSIPEPAIPEPTPTPPEPAPAAIAAPEPPAVPASNVLPWANPSVPSPAKPAPESTGSVAGPDIAGSDIAAPEPAQPDDDLLATMPVKFDEDKHAAPVVSTQVGPKTFPWKWVVPVVIIVVLAVVIVDILLDADFISWAIPHTHFLQ